MRGRCAKWLLSALPRRVGRRWGAAFSDISLYVLLLIGLCPLLILREPKMILDESEALSKSCRFACCNP
jgi:hypothetical protein